MAKRQREYMMAPFRTDLDQDIRDKYFSIPEGKRSDALRDAFRLYCGLHTKVVYERTEQPIIKRNTTKPLMMGTGKGVKR